MQVSDIVKSFRIYGSFVDAVVYGRGHINSTYISTFDQGGRRVRYIHQKINHHVFKSPHDLMHNVYSVVQHLHAKCKDKYPQDYTRRVLSLVPTYDDKFYHLDENENVWRTYFFIEGASTYEILTHPSVAEKVGKAFGSFQSLLADLPADSLYDTLPLFHDGPYRFSQLEQAMKNNYAKRHNDKTVQECFHYLENHKKDFWFFHEVLQNNELPIRITHNDTKLNNLLIDDLSEEGICVLDLDTVMPGLIHYDFGDMMRSVCASMSEEDQGVFSITMKTNMFEYLTQGYLQSAGHFLTRKEIEYLPFSGIYITQLLASRFLSDYLDGDLYFRTEYENHNLMRACNQIALAKSMYQQLDFMHSYIQKIIDD